MMYYIQCTVQPCSLKLFLWPIPIDVCQLVAWGLTRIQVLFLHFLEEKTCLQLGELFCQGKIHQKPLLFLLSVGWSLASLPLRWIQDQSAAAPAAAAAAAAAATDAAVATAAAAAVATTAAAAAAAVATTAASAAA